MLCKTWQAARAEREADKLSRAFLGGGGLTRALAKEAPALRLLTDHVLAASLRTTLLARPPGDAWLFGYGSLIWNPTVRSVETRVARIDGWRRCFCLSVIAGRGSVARPGLVLGLDAGGSCEGVAFRLAEDDLENELALLWRREMATGAYVPRWVSLLDLAGRRFGAAIAFTIDPGSNQYAGALSPEQIAERIASATGSLGSCADYLFRTRDALDAVGVSDSGLETVARHVAAVLVRQHEDPARIEISAVAEAVAAAE